MALVERKDQVIAFLAKAGVSDAVRVPLPADASTRRYERLILPSGQKLMLMDAPPALEGLICTPDMGTEARKQAGYNATARLSAGRMSAYVAVGGYLRSLGLSAPEVIACDPDLGLALIEDLGDDLFARVIEQGGDETPLYLAAIEVLARIHAEDPPVLLQHQGFSWPLLTYDAVALQASADQFTDWMPRFDQRVQVDAARLLAWHHLWQPILARATSARQVLIHRDYHAENLMWMPHRSGLARIGMVDFQDGLLAHPSWDLHSLLQDARRDVPPALEARCLTHYFELCGPELDQAAFLASYAGLAALNQVRILGVFARLITRDGKEKYRQFMPRMWGHLGRNLLHPDLLPIRDLIKAMVPEEIHQWA